jgi:hypothetical protein
MIGSTEIGPVGKFILEDNRKVFNVIYAVNVSL